MRVEGLHQDYQDRGAFGNLFWGRTQWAWLVRRGGVRLIRKHRQRRQVCCHLLVKYKIAFCTDVLSTVVNSADGPNFIIFMPSVDGWWKFKQGTAIVPCAGLWTCLLSKLENTTFLLLTLSKEVFYILSFVESYPFFCFVLGQNRVLAFWS